MTIVAVDARQVYREQRRGMGKVLLTLLQHLAVQRPEWQFHLFHQFPGGDDPLAGLPQFTRHQRDFRGADRWDLWQRCYFPWAAWRAKANVLFCPANVGPGFVLTPKIVMVHDVIPLHEAPDSPETQSWRKQVRRATQNAQLILTASEFSKQELIKHFELPNEKIRLLSWAPGQNMRRIDDTHAVTSTKARYGLQGNQNYILSYGASDPRKNTQLLIEAYAGLPIELRQEFHLLLIGVQATGVPKFQEWIDQHQVNATVHLHQYALEEDLPVLLTGATLLAFPSRAEGFGLPMIDAFACGCPVLSGNRTSLPEIGGDAAEYVDVMSAEPIRLGLLRLLQDPERRKFLTQRGAERVRNFDWSQTARTLAEALHSVARH